ncbi:MAG: hypothetical protein JSW06_02775 [Thermoplasmatales archaeon]|nr:MAG: hypothetical protein JSW06_02775 [Thermoplasmatales archaeon]
METYGWTQDYVLWELSLPQVLIWSNLAIESKTGKFRDRALNEDDLQDLVDKINNDLVWNDETGRYE